MSNAMVEGLFLLAFWVPPAAVLAGALSLIVRLPSHEHSPAHPHASPLAP